METPMCINIFSYLFTQAEESARSLHVYYFRISGIKFAIFVVPDLLDV